MQPVDSSSSATSILNRIILLYGGLALVSITFNFLGGAFRFSPIQGFWNVSEWAYAAILALVMDYSRRMRVPPKEGRGYRWLFLAPGITQIALDVCRGIEVRSDNTPVGLVYLVVGSLDLYLAFFGVVLLWSAYRDQTTRPNISTKEVGIILSDDDEESSALKDISSPLLGRGNSYVDRVIKSVVGRSIKSESVARFSLIIMLILVAVGGMASFGLWAFTHADRISTLQAEQSKLIKLNADMKGLQGTLGAGSEQAKSQLEYLVKYVEQNYATSPTYEATLNRLTQQTQSNYADIAIRVTIAVLTIFLVQVFFSVYKYNRHLAIMLSAKAEALELVSNDDDARKELSREAVSIVKESIPGFGPHPRTPMEEAGRMTERFLRK